MAKIDNIQAISMHEQHTIRIWYRTSKYIILLLLCTLVGITGIHVYLLVYNQNGCVPHIDPLYAKTIKNRCALLKQERDSFKKIGLLQENGKKSLLCYKNILATHIHTHPLTHMTDIFFSSTNIKGTYILSGLTEIQRCVDTLKVIPSLTKVHFKSFDQQNISTKGFTCIIHADWC